VKQGRAVCCAWLRKQVLPSASIDKTNFTSVEVLASHMAIIGNPTRTNLEQSWFLETISAPLAREKNYLRPGELLHFGRQPEHGLAFPSDEHMSRIHFSATFDGATCKIKDMNSRNGTFVNGTRVQEAIVACNDLITAGETTFTLGFEVAEIAHTAEKTRFSDPHDRLLYLLRYNFQPLFAILDAARDPYIYALLLQSQSQYQSLYEGTKGVSLSDVAPYLVQLPQDSALLQILVREGWGKSWGVYLKCAAEFQDVRRHLRHFLEVRQPDGEQVYFRFYDPRVVRVYLPTLGPSEARAFLGTIHCYLMEDKEPHTLLQFLNARQGIVRVPLSLTAITQSGQGTALTTPETHVVG
jgi:hypothetical protein